MEQTSKSHLVIGVLVVAAIVGIVIWFSLQNQEQSPNPNAQVTQTPVQTPNQPAAQENSEDINVSPKDSSDLALNQELNAIDKQLNGLDQDSSTITEGLQTPAEPQQ